MTLDGPYYEIYILTSHLEWNDTFRNVCDKYSCHIRWIVLVLGHHCLGIGKDVEKDRRETARMAGKIGTDIERKITRITAAQEGLSDQSTTCLKDDALAIILPVVIEVIEKRSKSEANPKGE